MSLGLCILFIIIAALIGGLIGFGVGIAWLIDKYGEE